MIGNLAGLLAPASAEDLASAIVQRRRLFVRSEDPQRFRDLLPWRTINTLFSINRFGPGQIRVVRASNDASPALYRDPADWSRLKLDALQALAAQGVSVVVHDIDKLVPAVAAVSAMAERHLRSLTWVNAYLTFRQAAALQPHWDEHDVLVLQVQGRKRWRSHGFGSDHQARGHTFVREQDAGPVEWEDVLHPGDVLYLPQGEVHSAHVEPGSTSVHLTIGVRPPRGSDVLRWLATGSDAALRADVSPAWNADGLQHHEVALKEAMHRLVDSIDLKAFLDAMDRGREARPAANLGALVAIDPGTWLASALRRRVPLVPTPGGSVELTVGGATYQLSPASAALLALLQDRDAMTMDAAQAALGEFDLETMRRAASDLAQRGLIHVGLED